MSRGFVFGVEGLDKLFGEALKPPATIVIAGHPGAGKTTLASSICYYNAINGHKCFYVSLQEDKAKLYGNMRNLGLDLEALESKGLIKFAKFPLYSEVSEIANEISSAVSSEGFSVVVIDSVNPLLQAVKGDYGKRAWLQNYFYDLARVINGVVVLVAEFPFGKKRIELGAIEFVVDAMIILKHDIERGLLTRKIEIRKARGAPLHIAEMPFTIQQGKGLVVYVPPILEEIAREGPEISIPCEKLRSIMGDEAYLHKGMVLFIAYPPDARPLLYVPVLFGIIIANNLRAHVISYLYPPEIVKLLIYKSLGAFIERERVEMLVDKHIKVSGINPFTYSLCELLYKELEILSKESDIVVFHSVDIPYAMVRDKGEYLQQLYNQINYLKNMQKLVVRIASVTSEEMYNLNTAISDVVMRFELERKDSDLEYKLYVWRRGLAKPFILGTKDLMECICEITEKIKKLST